MGTPLTAVTVADGAGAEVAKGPHPPQDGTAIPTGFTALRKMFRRDIMAEIPSGECLRVH